MKYLVGLDNGGTVVKAAVFDENGKQLSSAAQRIGVVSPCSGYAERNMEDIWQTNASVISRAVQLAGIACADIAGVGISGHGKGLYMLGKDQEIIYNGILSTDSRALKYEEEFRKSGTEEIIKKTNYQRVLACQPICLLRWFKDNLPQVYAQIGTVFSVKDYVRYRFTGEIYAERTDVSGTNLLNLRDGSYDREILELAGIGEIMPALPPLKNSADVCGYVTKDAEKVTGIPAGTPVSGGLFDIDACAVGMGIADSENICVIGGTWSINEYISKEPVTDGTVSMNSYYCIPEYYLIEECSPTSASNLDWVINMFFAADVKECGGINEKLYKEINRLAESAAIDHTVLFYPFLYASNESGMENATLMNLTADTKKEEILRAVFEGITFSHKTHIDRLLKARKKPRAIRLAGGVANSAFWSQMFADILNLPVETVRECEHGCLGAAITAGIAAGIFASYEEAVKKCIRITNTYTPNPQNHQIYQKKYSNYKKAIK